MDWDQRRAASGFSLIAALSEKFGQSLFPSTQKT